MEEEKGEVDEETDTEKGSIIQNGNDYASNCVSLESWVLKNHKRHYTRFVSLFLWTLLVTLLDEVLNLIHVLDIIGDYGHVSDIVFADWWI